MLFSPMQLGTFQEIEYAFSPSENAGGIRFSFEVDCPSTYRLFGLVRDDMAGTSGCCDPDSFRIEGPEGLDDIWFYGCDTDAAGWSWLQMEAGEDAVSCDQTAPLLLPLSAGLHEFTLRNREGADGRAVAGIAEVVLTNDPDYAPEPKEK